MKIPENIQKLIIRRDKLFIELMNVSSELNEWFEESEKFNKTLKTDDWKNKYQKWLYDQFKS